MTTDGPVHRNSSEGRARSSPGLSIKPVLAIGVTIVCVGVVMLITADGTKPGSEVSRPHGTKTAKNDESVVTVNPLPGGTVRQPESVNGDSSVTPKSAISLLMQFEECLAATSVAESIECARNVYGGDWLAAARDHSRLLCFRQRMYGDRDVEFLLGVINEYRGGPICKLFDAALQACEVHVVSDLTMAVVRSLWQSDPQLAMLAAEEVAGTRVFDDYATHASALLLAEIAILANDQRLEEHLLAMNRGEYGGSALQIDYSVTLTARLLTSNERIKHVEQICEATHPIPADPRIGFGSTLAHFALLAHDGTPVAEADATAAILRLLDHPEFGAGAAVTIAEDFPNPPAFISESTWGEIRAHARMVASR